MPPAVRTDVCDGKARLLEPKPVPERAHLLATDLTEDEWAFLARCA